MSAQQQQLPWAEVAGFTFNMLCMVAIDFTKYDEEPLKSTDPKEKQNARINRKITLYLIDGIKHTFEGPRADTFAAWFKELSTPQQVQRVERIRSV